MHLHLESIHQQQLRSENKAMRIAKIIFYIILIILIVSQIIAILEHIDINESYNQGYVLGKLIVIILAFIGLFITYRYKQSMQ